MMQAELVLQGLRVTECDVFARASVNIAGVPRMLTTQESAALANRPASYGESTDISS
jgi:hypothetical protein